MRRLPPPPSRTPRRPAAVLVAALALLLAACGSETSTPAASPGGPSPTGGAAEPEVSPSPSPSPSGTTPARPDLASVRVGLETVAGGFDAPLFVTTAGDGSGRLFVAEQGGRIRQVADGRAAPDPFLDISDRVRAGGEQGLLGVAFPPGFGSGRTEVYVHYSGRDGETVVSSFGVRDGGAGRADPASERVILTEPQPFANHNGGWIGFDGDGMLLVALGDGGSAGDPGNRASSLEERLGKILRIDVLGAAGDPPFAIPPDNPFVDQPGARPEILHLGLRNPYRASVDGPTGDLWIGDVGQNRREEVDVAPAGARGLDFGWRRWEGTRCYEPREGCDPAGVTQPVAEYDHAGGGCSVVGGVVYRGEAIPALRGGYLFADYCTGTLWAIDAGRRGPQEPVVLLETGRRPASIGQGEDGEVLLTDHGGGELLRLVPAG